ncbi:flagellar hook-length control protein [Massilia sp. TWP1-3-3]|uniref:flagellar hook-length control protein n=1 Tax=Massilia sp. TWP1-3-3 TaxID=2804573 RepID=UPI003CF67BB3
MSIALSAVIHPSRLLRLALVAWGAAAGAAALLLVFAQPALCAEPAPLALSCAGVALLAWRCALESANARQIDISGPGEIRLSVKQSLGAARAFGEPLLLLPGSTVWPSLLILLLRDNTSGVITVVPILPDSVAAGQFRKIAVSIRWIARRDNKFSDKNKIL